MGFERRFINKAKGIVAFQRDNTLFFLLIKFLVRLYEILGEHGTRHTISY